MISPAIAEAIAQATGAELVLSSARPVSGGCIHHSELVETRAGGLVFVKRNRANLLALFRTESESLDALASTGTIRVPRPLCHGVLDGQAFLALEGIRMGRSGDGGAMGRAIADLHECQPSVSGFGFPNDNFIGATPQPNGWKDDWADFFCEHRLSHQFRLARHLGKTFHDEEKLLDSVHEHLSSLAIVPSLLHGDLWGGNASFDESGAPVVFDPACYYGDREADIAFTRLFGGFDPDFYLSYRVTFPEPEPVRHEIYDLYHLLNHFVLFGGDYARQAEESIGRILRAI